MDQEELAPLSNSVFIVYLWYIFQSTDIIDRIFSESKIKFYSKSLEYNLINIIVDQLEAGCSDFDQ